MNNNLKIILVIVGTFTAAFLTSLLLEIPLFQHWIRQIIVVLFICLQFYIGVILYNFLIKIK
tara:strand:+ start:696 stop:881 length:186 start_codon:yes stop_codon:yes gene_type:complete